MSCSSSSGQSTGVAGFDLAEIQGACPTSKSPDATGLPALRHVRATFSIEGGGDSPTAFVHIAAWRDDDGTVSRMYFETKPPTPGTRDQMTFWGFTQWKGDAHLPRARRPQFLLPRDGA